MTGRHFVPIFSLLVVSLEQENTFLVVEPSAAITQDSTLHHEQLYRVPVNQMLY